jgi:hypothetical protein
MNSASNNSNNNSGNNSNTNNLKNQYRLRKICSIALNLQSKLKLFGYNDEENKECHEVINDTVRYDYEQNGGRNPYIIGYDHGGNDDSQRLARVKSLKRVEASSACCYNSGSHRTHLTPDMAARRIQTAFRLLYF